MLSILQHAYDGACREIGIDPKFVSTRCIPSVIEQKINAALHLAAAQQFVGLRTAWPGSRWRALDSPA